MSLSGCGNNNVQTADATAQPSMTAAPTAVPADIDASTVDYTTQTWVALEIVFESSVTYQKAPIYDVNLDVIFTAPDGTTIAMPGFWDGGTTWKVRFAPTMYGVWTYKTTCSDATNTGLNGKEGKIGCNAYKGDLAIYKHGFITTQADTRYFTYADGTPFFYIGDTHWSLGFEAFSTSNVAGIDSQFKYIVDKRVEQGFTVYQSEPGQAPQNKYGDKTYNNTLIKFNQTVLPGFWNMDQKFKYIADKGLVHANAQLFFTDQFTAANMKYYTDDYLDKLSRYWVARYAAYPVLWTTAQEPDATFYGVYDKQNNPWKKVFNAVYKYDPYKHPSTAHQENTYTTIASTSAFKDLEGYKWFGAQWAPNTKGQVDFAIPKDYWNNSNGRPAINYEGWYDNFYIDTAGARAQGWLAYLNGMFGQGYGVAGIWTIVNDYKSGDYSCSFRLDEDKNGITKEEKQNMTWDKALQLPAAEQLATYMHNFFNSFEWWKLEPCFDDPKAEHISLSSSWYSAATISNQTYVAYFYNTTTATGNITNLESGKTYTAKWFNPRTGEYTDIANDITGQGEKAFWKIPNKPDTQDWVIYVTINE